MRLLSLDEVEEGMICNQTLCDSRGTILISRGSALTANYIRRLRKFGTEKLWIQDDPSEGPPPDLSETPFADATLAVIQQLSEEIRTQQPLKIGRYADKIAEISYAILAKPFLQELLVDLSLHQALFHHSLRTMIISLALGVNKRYDRANLECLALCALLHDCGMNGDFCESDEDHPINGFRRLHAIGDLDMIVALSCLQHHERFDGQGFPFHFARQQTTEFARIVTLADVYDRMILGGQLPRPAVFKIIAGMGTRFDPTIVRLFETTLR